MVAISTRHTRWLLWSVAVVSLVGAALVVVLSLSMPVELATSSGGGNPPLLADRGTTRSVALSMVDFAPLLIGRLYPAPAPPPPPVVPVVEQAPPPPPTPQLPLVQLLGTAIENGHSYAVFQTPDGIAVRRQGEALSGSLVERIDDGVVVLKREGVRTKLHIPPPAGE